MPNEDLGLMAPPMPSEDEMSIPSEEMPMEGGVPTDSEEPASSSLFLSQADVALDDDEKTILLEAVTSNPGLAGILEKVFTFSGSPNEGDASELVSPDSGPQADYAGMMAPPGDFFSEEDMGAPMDTVGGGTR